MDAMSTSGAPTYLPTTRAIRDAFDEEIAALGGAVRDAWDDGARLFLRGVLPAEADVRPGDAVQGGVAVRVVGGEILVHPYTFRQVCTNGAIRAFALETRRVARGEGGYEGAAALAAFAEAVRACAAPSAFARGVDEMRTAAESEADYALMLMPMLARMDRESARRLAERVVARFEGGPARDRSAYGLLNAVTSVARDTRDPETRWRLEELGGGMPALLPRRPRAAPSAAALAGV